MKKVDVIMSSTLESIIGPVQTIKRIRNNHVFFLENGYDIRIFTSDNLSKPITTKIKESQSRTIKILKQISYYLSKKSWIYSWYRIHHLFTSCHPLLEYYSSLNRKPDMIVFHSLMDFYMYMKYYRIEGVKTACFTHSDGLLFKMLLLYYPRLIGSRVDRKLKKIADYLMDNVDVKPCIAKIEEKNLLEHWPQLKGKTCLVVNAIDDLTEQQKVEVKEIKKIKNKYKYRLVCTGSVQRRKGQYTIITALNELPNSILNDFHLTIIGDGPDKTAIEEYITSNPRLSEHIDVHGAVKNAQVYSMLAKANIMILMSENEGLPISLIEGLRSGLALISTNVSGIPELINENVNGKLLNPDKGELVELFIHFNEYNWEAMGKESRRLFENYYVFTRMRNDYLNMLNMGTQTSGI